jgi:uncharacterized protein (TIGR02266 family)
MVVVTSRNMSKGQRSAPRAEVQGSMAYLSDSRIVIARSADVSMTGAFVATRVPDAVGTGATLRLQLGATTMMLEAEVVRVSFATDPQGRGAGMGLKFVDLDRAQRRFLAKYVSDCRALR